MTLRKCACGTILTTKNITKLVPFKTEWLSYDGSYMIKMLWFNCNACGTSPVLKLKKDVVNEKNNLINNSDY